MLARLLCVALLTLCLSGCLIARRISDVAAHDSYNSYKVQTHSVYYGFFSTWQEWEVWNCHRDQRTYRCSEVEYDENKQGISRPENATPTPTAAPAPEPTAPAPEPAAPAATEGGQS